MSHRRDEVSTTCGSGWVFQEKATDPPAIAGGTDLTAMVSQVSYYPLWESYNLGMKIFGEGSERRNLLLTKTLLRRSLPRERPRRGAQWCRAGVCPDPDAIGDRSFSHACGPASPKLQSLLRPSQQRDTRCPRLQLPPPDFQLLFQRLLFQSRLEAQFHSQTFLR
jgi:hypothetical protein